AILPPARGPCARADRQVTPVRGDRVRWGYLLLVREPGVDASARYHRLGGSAVRSDLAAPRRSGQPEAAPAPRGRREGALREALCFLQPRRAPSSGEREGHHRGVRGPAPAPA